MVFECVSLLALLTNETPKRPYGTLNNICSQNRMGNGKIELGHILRENIFISPDFIRFYIVSFAIKEPGEQTSTLHSSV